MIQMINLKKQYKDIRDEIMDAIADVLDNTQYILGPRVHEFEQKVTDKIGCAASVSCASGTDALHLAVKSLGIGEGDEVITTPFTFFATVEAIMYENATPVFVDIEPDTFNIDPVAIENAITERTKAIIPVHLFGHPANMDKIMDIAARHKLVVIEDCAQSFGATIRGKQTGSFGEAGCFSFYPSKNLGAYGDGGLITLSNDDLSDDIRRFRNHGTGGHYQHLDIGINSRLDEIQAAILLVKFKHIDRYNELRRKKAHAYTELLKDTVQCPVEKDGYVHVYHQYSIIHPNRDRVREALTKAEIASNIYYPIPAHLQAALEPLGYKEGSFPVVERTAQQILALPICPDLEDSSIEKIASVIKSV